VIQKVNLPPEITGPVGDRRAMTVDLSKPLPDQLATMTAALEEQYLRKALQKTRGHVGKCAELSGLSRRSITDKIAQYQIDKSLFKSDGDDES
jgi:two-component system response regulator AtoC